MPNWEPLKQKIVKKSQQLFALISSVDKGILNQTGFDDPVFKSQSNLAKLASDLSFLIERSNDTRTFLQ